jgi:hypothetical protein
MYTDSDINIPIGLLSCKVPNVLGFASLRPRKLDSATRITIPCIRLDMKLTEIEEPSNYRINQSRPDDGS